MSTRMHRASSVNWLRNHSFEWNLYMSSLWTQYKFIVWFSPRAWRTLQLQCNHNYMRIGHLMVICGAVYNYTLVLSGIICCACIWLNSMPCICITIFIYLLSHYPMAPIVCNLLDYLLLFIYHSVGSRHRAHSLCKCVLSHSRFHPQ